MDTLRRCVFRPYRKGMGPVFSLVTFYVPGTFNTGQQRVGYRLRMDGKVLFEGKDYGCSPLCGIDSDDCVAGIMGFLTLRPGDTDAEYFAKYTQEQMDYCTQHAESLSCYLDDRFGKEEKWCK